ncbi:hypothetical protein TeGR_g12710, partial [Tetraparma gracilis]
EEAKKKLAEDEKRSRRRALVKSPNAGTPTHNFLELAAVTNNLLSDDYFKSQEEFIATFRDDMIEKLDAWVETCLDIILHTKEKEQAAAEQLVKDTLEAEEKAKAAEARRLEEEKAREAREALGLGDDISVEEEPAGLVVETQESGLEGSQVAAKRGEEGADGGEGEEGGKDGDGDANGNGNGDGDGEEGDVLNELPGIDKAAAGGGAGRRPSKTFSEKSFSSRKSARSNRSAKSNRSKGSNRSAKSNRSRGGGGEGMGGGGGEGEAGEGASAAAIDVPKLNLDAAAEKKEE